MIEEREDRRPERNDGMARVGEPNTALPVDHEIARLVVILAVEQRIHRNGAPIGRELDEAAPTLLRAVELAARTEREPVDAVGVAAQLHHCNAGVIERQQLSAVDRAEHDGGARTVPHHAADRSLERSGDSFELPSHLFTSYQTIAF